MFTVFDDLHWVGLLVAFLAFAAFGGLYFTVLVPKLYVTALGRQGMPAPKTTAVNSVGPVVCIAITVLTSAVLIEALNVTEISDALAFGLIVGVGYLLSTMTNIAINPNFPRPLFYAALNAPFFLGGAVGTAVILTALR